MSCVEPMYRRPSVGSFTDVYGSALFTRYVDESRHKAVIAISVDRWWETHYRYMNSAVRHRPRSLFGGHAWVRVRRSGHCLLRGESPRREKADSRGDHQRTSRASKRRTQSLNGFPIVLAILLEF